MLIKPHWTARYVWDRMRQWLHQRVRPDSPWLSRQAAAFLSERLRPTDVVVEWGAGRSTVWLARRVGSLVSIEHSRAWHDRVEVMLCAGGIDNGDLRYVPVDDDQAYLAPDVPDESCDLVLIDGVLRDRCAVRACRLIKPGGMVAVDNANWYLPHATRSPASVGAAGQPASPLWSQFLDRVADWQLVWISDGVTDTAFYCRPRA